MWMIWETIDFAEKLGTIAEDQHSTRCVEACLAGAEVIKLNSNIVGQPGFTR